MNPNKKVLVGFALFAAFLWAVALGVAYCNQPKERQGETVPTFDYPMDKPTNIDLDTDDAGIGQ